MNGALPIILADQRLAAPRSIKGCIFGKSGIGKTSLLWTLDPATTLFMDLEAGDLAIEGWAGDTIRPRTWDECRDFAVFIDSITVAGRLCFQWAKGQPEAFSDKTGKPDIRGAYGLHGREMIAWLTHLQHTRSKNIWFVGILDEKLDDFNRKQFVPQIDGAKTGLELPGIVDEVISMVELRDDDGAPYRAFVCQTLNPYGFPAKDRSGRLDMIEPPDLGRLMDKIRSGSRLTVAAPASAASTQPPANAVQEQGA